MKIPGAPDLIYLGRFPSPLAFQKSAKSKKLCYKNTKFEAMVSLDQAAIEEVAWWRNHLHAWNRKALFQKPIDLIIETDVSRKRWGRTV